MITDVTYDELTPYENNEFGFIISFPNGWQLQEPSKLQENAPDISVTGPKIGVIPPAFSITIEENSEKTFEEEIIDMQELIQIYSEQKNMIDVIQNKESIGKYDAYIIEGTVPWKQNGESFPLQFKSSPGLLQILFCNWSCVYSRPVLMTAATIPLPSSLI